MLEQRTAETAPAATSAGDWLSTLTPTEKRTFWATFGGFGLDALNIQLYSFVIPILIPLWGMSRTQAGLIATVSLVISAIGGWVGGIVADRIGRVVMARGRDAGDVPITMAFGQNSLQRFDVTTYEVDQHGNAVPV